MSKDEAAVRDQLGNDPDVFPLLNANYTETVVLEEGPLRAILNTIGNSWVVGSSTNGIVGTNTGTQGGGQQVVGQDSRVETVQLVINPNNQFIEHFRYDRFEDQVNTTATPDYTTNYRVDFTSGQVYQSLEVFKDNVVFTGISVSWTQTGTLTMEVSVDASTWETVSNGVSKTLNTSGTKIYYRATESGASTATLSDLTIQTT